MTEAVSIAARVSGPVSQHPERLARELKISRTVAHYLARRGFVPDEQVRRFLDPKLKHLTRPDEMADRQVAAERLKRAIVDQERIFVFGDYDCDGITSTAILTEVLSELGAAVEWGLGSRFDGGYGVSQSAVRRIVDSGARLLVTCDCGSSDHDTLELVREAGLDIIVIDHHLVPDAPLPVQAFLNPHRSECGFPYKGLASCGLALSIAAALRQALGSDIDLRRWLDLVAIGSIADVAPLDGDNRALVRAGLARLSEAPRPGLRALMALAEIEVGRPLSARDVAFRIAPRINAPGRLGSAELALDLLLAKNADEAERLASEIEQKSSERRALQLTMLEQALEEIEREGWQDSAALTLGRQEWNHGIVGIVAGRLADQFQRPVIVIGFEGNVGRGSVRGPRGARLHDALTAVQSTLVRFGGHQAAAGVEVEFEKLPLLRQRFAEVYLSMRQTAAVVPDEPQVPLLELCRGDNLCQVLKDLMLLEPCGEANPRPELSFVADLVRAKEVRGGHLKLELELETGQRLSGFFVQQGALAETLAGRVRVTGSLEPDRWRGGDAVEVRVSSICACAAAVPYETADALSG